MSGWNDQVDRKLDQLQRHGRHGLSLSQPKDDNNSLHDFSDLASVRPLPESADWDQGRPGVGGGLMGRLRTHGAGWQSMGAMILKPAS